MTRYESLLASVGDTPVVGLPRLSPRWVGGAAGPHVRLWAKLENRNPSGSLKDRPAVRMIDRFLGEKVPGVEVVAAEPRRGETVYALRNVDDGFVPELYDEKVLTRRCPVSEAEARRRVRDLIDQEGIFAGISTGAVRHAALIVAEEALAGGRRADIAFIVCDAGWKNLSTGVYDATGREQ